MNVASSRSGEVCAGGQPGFREGPVHKLPVPRGRAPRQQGSAGEPGQVHIGPLFLGSQVLAER